MNLRRSSGEPRPSERSADVVITAAAPFGPSAYARARLLRHVHAAGLLRARARRDDAPRDQTGD